SLYSLADLKKKKGVKLIVSYAENIPYRQVFDGKTNYIKHYSFESIDHFIPWCDTIKRVLILEGVSEEKITTVYAGIDINMFKPEPKDADMLKEFELSEDNFIISYVGKLVSWKGIHNLAYAAKALLQNGYKKFCFLITGNGAQLENLKKIITEAGIGKHFRFTGFVPYGGMGKIHNLADVFVLTSYPTMTWQEQFGMVLIEAMACNKPVIATTTGSIPEIVGDAGVVVPPGDFFQLAQEIAKFIDNRELIQIKGENARQRVEAHFDARKNALKLYNIYKKVLQC
ncbi:MAG: glycosyltransferase family 4 protein, partial [Deltaproteobacteria bacterium]|nr:glycosyltransferase family 4 protein [Deltaproteobacteria bacterium]